MISAEAVFGSISKRLNGRKIGKDEFCLVVLDEVHRVKTVRNVRAEGKFGLAEAMLYMQVTMREDGLDIKQADVLRLSKMSKKS